MDSRLRRRIIEKFVYTFTSLKFWGLVIVTLLSTLLLYDDKLTGTEWVTVITSVYAVIFSIREVFKQKTDGLDTCKESSDDTETTK